MLGPVVSRMGIKVEETIPEFIYTRKWRIHAFAMLGSVSHMGIKVEEPHSQSTVGTAAPAVAAVPPAVETRCIHRIPDFA
jgi:hypothetical protein